MVLRIISLIVMGILVAPAAFARWTNRPAAAAAAEQLAGEQTAGDERDEIERKVFGPYLSPQPSVQPQSSNGPASELTAAPDDGKEPSKAEQPSAPLSENIIEPKKFKPGDVVRIQRRLIDLGYLLGEVDGKWRARSKRALQAFRVAQGLGADAEWDDRTQRALFAAPLFGFVGKWTPEAGRCGDPSGPAPLTINAQGAKASLGGSCNFHTVRQESKRTWRIIGKCLVSGVPSDADFRLTATSSELTWESPRQKETYYRCP